MDSLPHQSKPPVLPVPTAAQPNGIGLPRPALPKSAEALPSAPEDTALETMQAPPQDAPQSDTVMLSPAERQALQDKPSASNRPVDLGDRAREYLMTQQRRSSQYSSYPEEQLEFGGVSSIVEQIEQFLEAAVQRNVSDIHLRCDYPPYLRLNGSMLATKLPPMTEGVMTHFIQRIMPPWALGKMRDFKDFDFSFELRGRARFRCNLFYEQNRPGLVMRSIRLDIPTLEQLGVPEVLARFTEHKQGIVLVTGPTGSGKSTTLAAMLNLINHRDQSHIVTIEDPIEYVYPNVRSVFTQREIGTDTPDFSAGVKYSLRQDPDVILIGEMRDRETIMTALHAAETGHLVFSTLHTIDAVQTITRIINIFEPHEREAVRLQLSQVLMGTMAQRLVKKVGGGRVPVNEILTISPAIRDYIAREELDEIYNILKSAHFDDTCSLNASLYRAVRKELISVEDAMNTSNHPAELHQLLRGAYHSTSGNS